MSKDLSNIPDDEKTSDKLNSFSIVIPTCERQNLMQRSVRSAQNQIYEGDFEVVVVDDGSTDKTWEILKDIVKEDSKVRAFRHKGRMQRCQARNTGMKKAKNDWICWLDADDEYMRTYLDSANWAINEYPDYKIFHFGAIVSGLRGYRVRDAANIGEEVEGPGMEKFKSGCIGTGSFFFKRELLDDVGYLPVAGSPYKFADLAKEELPEIMEWFGPKYLEGGKELGNPWGDDWFMFYKLTRKYKSKQVPFLTYVQYVRRSGFLQQDNDRILNRPNVIIA